MILFGEIIMIFTTRMLMERFGEIDYASAVNDVINFIDLSEYNAVRIWCAEMFSQISEGLKPQ